MAGVAEIIFGLSILGLRRSPIPIYAAAASLALLLLYILIMLPSLAAEAFNPVTTNLLGLALCYIAVKRHVSTPEMPQITGNI